MQQLFLRVVGNLYRDDHGQLDSELEGPLPEHVTLLLRYLGGVPRRCQFLFAALAFSSDPDEFRKSQLRNGLRLLQKEPERYCFLPCITTLPIHSLSLPVCCWAELITNLSHSILLLCMGPE